MYLIPKFGALFPMSGGHNNALDTLPSDVRDQLFQAAINSPRRGGDDHTSLSLNNIVADWKETPEAHVFMVELPGLSKEEIKIQVEDDRLLKISGERNIVEREGEKWHGTERLRGKFLRRFWLPENSKVEEVNVKLENGVLTVTVPKQPQPKAPEVKVIQVSD
eukprot:PITA_29110